MPRRGCRASSENGLTTAVGWLTTHVARSDRDTWTVPRPLVFVLEDDVQDRVAICEALKAEGYRFQAAETGQKFLALLGGESPDAVVLDIGLPDVDGRDVCRALRAFGVDAPILFLTRKDQLVDKLAGFDAGADDYIVKPFQPEEVAARLRAIRRRTARAREPIGRSDSMRLDAATHSVVAGDVGIRLSPTEYRVLAELTSRPGEVIRRRELIRSGWPRGAVVNENTLDAYVGRIRRKLRALPDPPHIETVHGVGYALQSHRPAGRRAP